MKRFVMFLTGCMAFAFITPANATEKTMTVTVSNPQNEVRQDYPVSITLKHLGLNFKVQSALVVKNGQEMPCQLDDMNGDNSNDELAFVTDLGPKEKSSFQIHLFSDKKGLRNYTSRVYAEMLVIDGQKKNVPIQSMSVLNDGNPYTSLYHHGPAFESELIALRVYFDNRQTVDAYGKFRKGLELKDTQFYPTKEQKKNGYGDDVLWVGTTAGVGTLRGWDGQSPAMITPVAKRTESIRAYGPVRTVVEVKDEGWNSNGSLLNMTTQYILYAGHRDCEVNVSFSEPLGKELFCVGVTNVKHSEEMSDHQGLLGCWGTDWPVDVKDSAGYKQETVGLAVCIPKTFVRSEPAPTKDNYLYVIGKSTNNKDIHYHLAFCSANESFGFKNKDEWFGYLKNWRESLNHPCVIAIK